MNKTYLFVFTLLLLLFFIQHNVSANIIGGTVWVDNNDNGIHDAGELGIPNVTVRLFYDNNNDRFPERIITDVPSDANGVYLFSAVGLGKYQIGVDPLSFPADKFRITSQNILPSFANVNDVNPHTFRTEIFDITSTAQANLDSIDIGILQGDSSLIFVGNGTVAGQPVNRWLYQDIHFQIQDTGLDPNDSTYQAIVLQWLKWYAVGERITQEAEVLDGYLDLARNAPVISGGVTTKQFLTVDGLGSYAAGRATTSSGIPATTLLNNPNVLVDHILMLYETTRGINPHWKYRSTWPFGARLSHHALTAIMLFEMEGLSALLAQPNVTPWNPGKDHLNELSNWESAGLSFETGFPILPSLIYNGGELINHTSIPFPNPNNPASNVTVTSRGLLTGIIVKVLSEMGRETALEIMHNMSTKSWYSPSIKQSLIDFKNAVNDATDGVYNSDFINLWGFPIENIYNDSTNLNSGTLVNQLEYKWDCKPHNYDPAKIRSGYSNLSDRTTQGFAKWIDADNSEFKNFGCN